MEGREGMAGEERTAQRVSGRGAVRGAVVTAVATLVSRVLGFVRDAVMAAVLGIIPELGAFTLAWVVPNLFRRLFGEGAVSAAILPALSRADHDEGRARARELYSRFQGAFLLGLVVLVAVLEALVLLARQLPFSDYTQQVLRLAAWLLPYLVPVCLTALAAAPQHLAGRFLLPAAAPAALNAVWITVLLVISETSGFGDTMETLVALSAGIVVGGALQWLMQWPGVRAAGFPVRPVLHAGDGTVRQTLRAFAPAMLGLAVVQLNFAVDQVLIRVMVNPAANTYSHLANRLLQLPLALVGISVATGVQPLFSRLAAEGRMEELSSVLRRAVESTFLIVAAAAGGLFATAPQVITVLFEHGKFGPENTAQLTEVLRAYLWCLPAAAVAGLLTRVRQVRGDYRGPAGIAAAVVPLNLVLDLALLPRLGVPGAGYATAAALTAQALLLAAGLPSLDVHRPVRWARVPRLLAPGALSTLVAVGGSALLGGAAYTVPGLFLVIAAGVLAGIAATAGGLPGEFRQLLDTLRHRKPPGP